MLFLRRFRYYYFMPACDVICHAAVITLFDYFAATLIRAMPFTFRDSARLRRYDAFFFRCHFTPYFRYRHSLDAMPITRQPC